jgi:hypothetical protein
MMLVVPNDLFRWLAGARHSGGKWKLYGGAGHH